MRVYRNGNPLNARRDNPRPMPLIPPFAQEVVPSSILTPLDWSPQNAVEMDSRYRQIGYRHAPELLPLPDDGVQQNVDIVWWAQGSSKVAVADRQRGGLPGFMPSRPANNPNTKMVQNGRPLQPIRLINPFDVPVPVPPTPEEFGDINYPAVGFFPSRGFAQRK